MRQVTEVLRLKWGQGLSDRNMAQSLGSSRPTVAEYVRRAQVARLSWPLPATLDETALERLLFPPHAVNPSPSRPEPDWATVPRELKRKGVTVCLRWQAYKSTTPEGLQQSRFCQGYRAWTGTLDLVMRQSHRAGEKLFVDDAGQGIPVVNPRTGEVHEVAMFVAVLGASHDTQAEATWPQSLPDWMGSHVRTFTALGGVPEVIIPDHLKAAVTRAHRDEPESNRTDAALAQHDGVAIIPARAAKPRDTAQVEVGVHVVERWILARLRPHTCFSLAEVNAALQPLLRALKVRPFKQWPGSRHALCDVRDRPALRPLPLQPYAQAEWKQARVHSDDHVDVDGHSDSVPSVLVKPLLDVRLSAPVVALCHKGKRVASHQRSPLKGRHSTVAAPRPTAHQHDAEWTPQRLMHWATHTGPATAEVVDTMLASRAHPPQGVRSC